MNKTTLISLFLCLLFTGGEVYSQKISLSAGSSVVKPSFQVGAHLDINDRMRVELSHLHFIPEFIGWSCTYQVKYRAWYTGANFSILFPIKERWALYSRTGLGMGFSHRFSEKPSELYEPRKSLEPFVQFGFGAEYRLERWRVFADAFFITDFGDGFDYPANIVLGVSYVLFDSNN